MELISGSSASEDLAQRRFAAKSPGPWCGSLTSRWTAARCLVYCCAVMTGAPRIVGWSIADRNRTELVTDALQRARLQRNPPGTNMHARRPRRLVHQPGSCLRQ
jgi:transposase InsO family protein